MDRGVSGADTIYALSSGSGRAGVAVIRISGSGAGRALAALCGELPPPRAARLRDLRRPGDGAILDRGLVLWFPGPASYTGEDMAELQIHGGRAVIAAVLAALGSVAGLRPAVPGEFTRRAFDRGKLDLAQVEGLADLISAETEVQRRQALRQAEGVLGRAIAAWREAMIGLSARLEAAIDFPEDDLPENLIETVKAGLVPLSQAIAMALEDAGRGERLRAGLSLAILGPPNAGKSTLLNWLAGRDAAIVAPEAGTTRDVIEVHLDLGGVAVTVADTAGLRESSNAIESEGVRRARGWAESADIRLLVLDAASRPLVRKELGDLANRAEIVAINKIDLGPLVEVPEQWLKISLKTGQGLESLLQRLRNLAVERVAGGADPLIVRERQRHALGEVQTALERASTALTVELMAEDLRLAMRGLGRITGEVDIEDVLDRIFAEFCIGK